MGVRKKKSTFTFTPGKMGRRAVKGKKTCRADVFEDLDGPQTGKKEKF